MENDFDSLMKDFVAQQRAKGKKITAWKGKPIDRKAEIIEEPDVVDGRLRVKYKLKYDEKVYQSELQRVKENSF